MENVDDLVCELGCKVGSLPSNYFGMPLGASFNSVAAWDGIEEIFRKRFLQVEILKVISAEVLPVVVNDSLNPVWTQNFLLCC
ncbi:hypothetical protein VitviT2T_006231 [Vitis vinifera]|uniref:Uncharacterized protein n=1 Tax=Vitis vinifera TaxID=29760 RepID=A0ABY9BX26_VITVI|nr:hypothetical protein VitviT2T_006231 [Vitis vinifera]